jgi:excinuclease UvrABC ATPase subunit
VDIPAGGLVAVTGVSGSGKSTLVFDVLAPALAGDPGRTGQGRATITLHERFARVVAADRDPLAGASSSMPATILGIFDLIRDRFAATEMARASGLGKRHFSTNVKGGRCERCEGIGRVRVSMDFLPDVWVPCDECVGRRFTPAVLACQVDGRSIADVLEMNVREARSLGRWTSWLKSAWATCASARGPTPCLEASGSGSCWPPNSSASLQARRSFCSMSRPPDCTSRTWPGCFPSSTG